MNQLSQGLVQVTSKATGLAILLLVSAPLFSQCLGNASIIQNSKGVPVGCAFSSWGPTEKSSPACNGATTFTGPNPSNCHICIIGSYDVTVGNAPFNVQDPLMSIYDSDRNAPANFTRLLLSPVPGAKDPPRSFRCLKCAQPPSGLTAWWSLDELGGPLHESTGRISVNGFRSGGLGVVIGEVGNAAQFHGGQFIEIPHDAQLNVGPALNGLGDFSIDAWVKIDTITGLSGVRLIAEKRAVLSKAHYKGYSFFLYNGRLGLQLADDGPSPGFTNYVSALTVPADKDWHFVAVSVARSNSSGILFSLDDQPVEVASQPIRVGSLANSSPLRLGMGQLDTNGFVGSIDELELFHRAVTPDEWQSIYSAKCYGKCVVKPVKHNVCTGFDSSGSVYITNWDWPLQSPCPHL